MDTSLNIPAAPVSPGPPAPFLDRSATKKGTPIDASDKSATRPAEKPFVAQIVNARLSGADFPVNPGEIAPPERTLRPYDVPMLPADAQSDASGKAAEQADKHTAPEKDA